MPIYLYQCPECNKTEEVLLPMGERDKPRIHCQSAMIRMPTAGIPIIKPTGNEMALNSLNSKDTSYIKPEHKAIAAGGLSLT
jgi:putative FmdB family regulatory protein